MNVALPLCVLFFAGCGARGPLEVQGSADAGSAPIPPSSPRVPEGGVEAGTSFDAGGDALPPASALGEKLTGHWMAQQIGDCIDAEDWYSFTQPSSLVVTHVDRNMCHAHSVTKEAGTFAALAGEIVSLDWSGARGHEARRFTAAILDPYPAMPAAPVPGYVMGKRALATKAYARSGATSWHREDVQLREDATGSYRTQVTIDVTLDAPLAPAATPTACRMTVVFDAKVDPGAGGGPAAGKETFDWPCTYGPTVGGTWDQLTANGFEKSAFDGTWMDFLRTSGIDAKYENGIVTLFEEAFRPLFSFAPADTTRLFHDESFALLYEVVTPPPDAP